MLSFCKTLVDMYTKSRLHANIRWIPRCKLSTQTAHSELCSPDVRSTSPSSSRPTLQHNLAIVGRHRNKVLSKKGLIRKISQARI